VKDRAPENYRSDWRTSEDDVPQTEPYSRYGNPENYEVFGKNYQVLDSNAGFSEKGLASWYGTKFHGERTSSGEAYDMYAMTAAHKSLRIPTYVEVTNLSNNRKAIVKVNDRGPFHEGRIIDLSYAAATKLGVAETGTAPVVIRVIENEKPEVAVPVADVATEAVVGEEIVEQSPEMPVEELVGDQFYVQIAAVSSEENALRMLDDLKKKNFRSVRIHVETVQAQNLYRVSIGPVPSTLVAEKLISRLKELNHNHAQIIPYN